MITKTKKSISLSNSLLEDLYLYSKDRNVSSFIEAALICYIDELKRQERIQKDIKIIRANSKQYRKEAEENLEFQDIL